MKCIAKKTAWLAIMALMLCLSRPSFAQQGMPSPGGGGGGFPGAELQGGSFSPVQSRGEQGVQAQSDLAASTTGDAIIQYDPQTDSIIVITDEATNQNIAQVIETLDKPVSQVLIKVLFLEVTHSNTKDLGVEASLTYGGKNPDTISTDFGVAAQSGGGVYSIVSDDLSVTMRALERIGRLEVLSRPSVLARNNETASITIGQEIPFIRNSRITDDGQTINTVEYEDIGIILEVTPHITADRMVEMEVAPEISTLTGDTVAISDTVDARVIAKRSAETQVIVPDGKTVVIGGLMEDNNTDTIEKVPLLGSIPAIGALFRRTIKTKAKTELIIFLTPYVINSPQEMMDVSVSETNRATLPAKVFTPQQQDKYLDNPGTGTELWRRKK